MFSIVIPAYNEENAIDDTINRCKNIIKEYGDSKSEIIVVDDASSDSTFEKVKKTGVVALKHPHNIGYGRSLKDGILESENDIIIITDADGTYPIESIPDLLEEYKKGYDMVVGARQGKHYHESFFKRRFRGILRFLVEFTAGRKIPDINSGLRVFGKKEIVNFFDTLCDTFSFTTSLTLAYMMKGKYVKYIPIEYEKRIGKTKVKLFKDSTRTLQFIVEAILYYNPIKIFLVFDYLLIILAVINLVIAFFTKLQIAYLIGVGSILLAILIFSLGLLSIQLKQLISRAK